MIWSVVYTKQAQKDAKKIASCNLKPQAQRLLDIIAKNPFQTPPPYEKLTGDLAGAYSRRINVQHRSVYQVDEAERRINILRLSTHDRLNQMTNGRFPFYELSPAPGLIHYRHVTTSNLSDKAGR